MYGRKRGNKTSFSLNVVGIKVTRPIWKLDDYGVYETYYRAIRFELFGGEVLEVVCSGATENNIKLRSVKTLKPVPKSETSSNPDSTEDWITPKIYKGTSDRETGLLQRIRKLFF